MVEEEYPADFDHPDFQAWLQEREGEILERMAWEKMEKAYREETTYKWQKPQKRHFTTGSKGTSPGTSSVSKQPQDQESLISGPVQKATLCGLSSKPLPPPMSKSERANTHG